MFIGEILNTSAKIRATLGKLAKQVGEGKVPHVCLEATGPYGERLFSECHKAGVRTSILNPAKVRHYANAISESAKTDPIDARVIRLFAEARKPQPTPQPCEAQVALRQLVLARGALSKSMVQLSGTLDSVEGSEAGKVLKKAIADIKKEISTLDLKIKKVLKDDEPLGGLSAALAEIEGVGVLTAAKIVALVPELGTLGRRRAAALAGLAPFTRDSGKWKGKTFISGGRPEVRRALFMPATVARTHNPILKSVYEKLRKDGKPYKVALTAVMRRLFCHMDAVAANWIDEHKGKAPVAPSVTTV